MSNERVDLDARISLAASARYFPERNGRKVHIKTIRRWVLKGVRGGRKLQVELVGGRYYTRPSWCEAFIAAGNPVSEGEREPLIVPRMDARKEAEIKRDLAVRGYYGAKKKREALGLD